MFYVNANVSKLFKTGVTVDVKFRPYWNFPITISILIIARGDVTGTSLAVCCCVGLPVDPVEQFNDSVEISY